MVNARPPGWSPQAEQPAGNLQNFKASVFPSVEKQERRYIYCRSPRALALSQGSTTVVTSVAAFASVLAVFFLVSYCAMLLKRERIQLPAERKLAGGEDISNMRWTEHNAWPICEGPETHPASVQRAPEVHYMPLIADANDETAGASSRKRKMEQDHENHEGFLTQTKKGKVAMKSVQSTSTILDTSQGRFVGAALTTDDAALSVEGWLLNASEDFEGLPPRLAPDEAQRVGGHSEFIVQSSRKDDEAVSPKQQLESSFEGLMYRPSAASLGYLEDMINAQPLQSHDALKIRDNSGNTPFSTAPVLPEAFQAVPTELQPSSTLAPMYGESPFQVSPFFGQMATQQGEKPPSSAQPTVFEVASSQSSSFAGHKGIQQGNKPIPDENMRSEANLSFSTVSDFCVPPLGGWTSPQKDISTHPFVRLPRVLPGAYVRHFGSALSNTSFRKQAYLAHALVIVKDLLKMPFLDSVDLEILMSAIERLVYYALRYMRNETEGEKPEVIVQRLALALLLVDSLYAASEVLGLRARRRNWWYRLMNVIPYYTGPSGNAATSPLAVEYNNLAQSLNNALNFYRRGMRPAPDFLVELKRTVLCANTIPALSRGYWKEWLADDRQWRESQGDSTPH